MSLTSQMKAHRDGTHRARTPADTWALIEPVLPDYGITRLADITGLDTIGIPVFTAVRPNSRSLATAQGKGLTRQLARLSAAMEAIEHHHGEVLEPPADDHAFSDIADSAIDPARLPMRAVTPYHPDRMLPWVEGVDLADGNPLLVPYDAVHLRYLSDAERLPSLIRSSNGLASGNTLEEAVVHGLCEVIERDATVIAELCRDVPERDRTLVRTETIEDPSCRELLDRIADAGLQVHLSDETSDLGVPCFAAVISEPAGTPPEMARGAYGGHGCHLDPMVALNRAITEAAQSRLTQISGARDDMYRRTYDVQRRSLRRRRFWIERQAAADPQVDVTTIPDASTPTLDGDLAVLLDRLDHADLGRAAMVDLSPDVLDIAVAKVVVEGLEFTPEGVLGRYGARAREQTMRALLDRGLFAALGDARPADDHAVTA